MSSPARLGRLGRLLRELPATFVALLVAIVVEVGLRTTTLPRLSRIMGAPLTSQGADTMAGPAVTELPPWAKRRISATRRVLRRWPYGDTCLRQALVSGQRLRRLDPRLHVGVAKFEGEIRAHAWLVVGGRILDPMRAAGSYLDLTVPGERGPA